MKNLILLIALFLGFQNYAQRNIDIAENNSENNLIDPDKTDFKIFQNIPFIETEEEFNLGFDTTKYLPMGYNPAVYYGDVLLTIQFIEEDETKGVSMHNMSKYQIFSEKDRDVLNSIKYINLDELPEDWNIFSQAERNFMKSIQFIENAEI
ncbi:MAG: hypothetical protein U1C58_09845 [Flavobacteriaceae bacterium]|nr:hypothetical protein [Flavobacteriaceae bacterium]MDZ4148574.1 hypothetical protein [Flavobacteriaceae bacterium]